MVVVVVVVCVCVWGGGGLLATRGWKEALRLDTGWHLTQCAHQPHRGVFGGPSKYWQGSLSVHASCPHSPGIYTAKPDFADSHVTACVPG